MDDKYLNKLLENKNYIIYGAHLIAADFHRYVVKIGINAKCMGFAVTSTSDNPLEIDGIKVMPLDNYVFSEIDVVLIAMPEKYHKEVKEILLKRGCKNVICIGLETMSKLKGQQILREYKKYVSDDYNILPSCYDYSWLDMKIKESTDGIFMKYKFPTVYYCCNEAIYEELNEKRILDELREFAESSNILKHYEREQTFGIFMAFGEWDYKKIDGLKYDNYVIPIQVGSNMAKHRYSFVTDDIGDNISCRNSLYAEMTAVYNIWKNHNDYDYKGLCHYRRHFQIDSDTRKSIESGKVDAVLTTPRFAPLGVGDMFINETPVNKYVMTTMLSAIEKLHPDEKSDFDRFIKRHIYAPNNMVIARNDLYNEYCEWIFPVLFAMENTDILSNYGHREDRHIAYAAELLTSYFFMKNSRSTIYIDYILS